MSTTLSQTPGQTLVIGISGGIAAGKSAAARALAGADGRILAADAIASEILCSPEIIAKLRASFGAEALDATGAPNRAAIARVVFDDAHKRELLEGWIHPAVRARICVDLSRARAEAIPVVVLDVPLLFENDADHDLVAQCDALVFVETPAATRDARAAQDRGWEPGEVTRREAAQLPLEDKRAASHFVIHNDGDLAALQLEAQRVLDALRTSPPHER